MSQERVEPLQPSEDYRLAEVHNLAFEEHIQKYGSFSGLRGLNFEDVKRWRKAEFFDPDGLLKADSGGIVGYCYVKLEEVVNENGEAYLAGYIKNVGDSCSLICVLPSWRRRGIGSALLERAESFIRSKGLGFSVAWSYQSDIAALEFLRKAGYTHRERFWVSEFSRTLPLNADVEFWKRTFSEPISSRVETPRGYSIRMFRRGDAVNFMEVYNSVWGRYGLEMTMEDVETILSDPQVVQILFAEKEGEAIGSAYFDSGGGVHLAGVKPEHAARGVGTALLAETFGCIKEWGYEEAHMSTSIVLEDALSLYKKLNCVRFEKLLCMVKYLS